MTKQTQAAQTFGSIAFAKGVACAPALDRDFLNTLQGRPVGDKNTKREMRAWIAGWTAANLAA